ncbi:MAG: hypothetical protein K9L98_04075 [Candidatus Pacebacteria bacterium]|nr:hypothetical protein [Candidatus Paceibacterota bacterium]MCF7863153.1 hypothetical protein [Candidatus Paceibacterota bacterium]
MNKILNKKGISILGILLLMGVAVLILSYFKISIKDVVNSPEAQENIDYVSDSGKSVWDNYLKEPAEYVWNEVFVGLLWQSFINNMERVRDGKPTEFEENAPKLPRANYPIDKDISNNNADVAPKDSNTKNLDSSRGDKI